MTMDPYNKAITGPIWQRVLNPSQGEIPWKTLLSETRRSARAYLSLSQCSRGAAGESLRRLSQRKEGQFYILSGLYRLQMGKAPALPPERPGPREGLTPALCRRYREEAALLAGLEGTGDPVFAALANRVREDMLEVLGLLGRAGG